MKRVSKGTLAVIVAMKQAEIVENLARDPAEVVSEGEQNERHGKGICKTNLEKQLTVAHFGSTVCHSFFKHERHTGASASARNVRSEMLSAPSGQSVSKGSALHCKHPIFHEGRRIKGRVHATR